MKKILIVEGNLREENESFSKNGIQTHTESLKDSLSHFTDELSFDVVNPSSDQNIQLISDQLEQYDGLIWGGSSLNIYKQVAVTAAGGQVKKADNSHIGIANEIEINKNGINHPLYKNKDKKFNSPAFNFDEVVKIPDKGICLASNKINKVQGLYFEVNKTKIWGLQYHPEITYEKMINLIEFRKERLIESRKVFKDDTEVQKHIAFIKKEISVSDKEKRMLELKNWLNELN